MLENLKKIFGGILGGKTAAQIKSSALIDSSARRNELKSRKLQGSESLPTIDGTLALIWSIQHDPEFEDILLYEFTTTGGTIVARELAAFADFDRARQLASMLRDKYGKQLTEFCLAPGVGVYIGGNDNAGWAHFVKHASELGFDLIEQDRDLVKRDGQSR